MNTCTLKTEQYFLTCLILERAYKKNMSKFFVKS